MTRHASFSLLFALLRAALLSGCARVALEGGDKPIHIVMDINVRIAHELDDFFAFEQKQPATTQSVQANPPAAPPAAAAALPH